MEGNVSTDTGSTTTGPATFSDASLSWSEASSPSTPETPAPATASASADATDPPVATDAGQGDTPAAGEPPKERWEAILANARQKAADEALAPYAWAKQVDPQEFQQIQQIARHFAGGDTLAGIQALLAEARKDPAIDAQLRSLHARALSQARGQTPQAPTEPQPDLPIQLEDGRVVHLYSAEQQAKREAWLQQQWLQTVKQEFDPVIKTHEQLKAEREAAVRQQQIDQFAAATLADVQTWPGMDDKATREAVAKALADAKVNPDDPREVEIALNRAYRQVVMPTLSQKAQSALLDTLKTKAAASTSVNPGSTAGTSPRTVTSFHDTSLQW